MTNPRFPPDLFEAPKDFNISANPAVKFSPHKVAAMCKDRRASEAFVLTTGCTPDQIQLAMQRAAGQVFFAVQDECTPILERNMTVWGQPAIYMSMFMTDQEHKDRVKWLREKQA